MLIVTARSQTEQEETGAAIAAALDGGCVIYLYGDLGAGKTTLARGFLRALGHRGTVKSPTYTLMEPYEVAGMRLFHLDLYRLSDPGELEYLGVRDLLESNNVLLVEWPEQGAGALPKADIEIHIRYLDEGRELQIQAKGERGEALLERIASQTEAPN